MFGFSFSAVGTGTRRFPGRFQMPWKETLLVTIILIVAGVLALGVSWIVSQNTSTPTVLAVERPVAQPFVATQNFQPVQQVPVVAPVATTWPVIQVTWTPVMNLSILPPAEEGFYKGTMQNAPYGATGSAECGSYAKQIWVKTPYLGAICAVARDPDNKQVVLAGFDIGSFNPDGRLVLSVDGEKTWREIQLPTTSYMSTQGPALGLVLPWEVRVRQTKTSISLFVYGVGGNDGGWRQATLPQ